eukprot:NODE_871_length_2023_cov_79.361053_g824_i0.p1 GENE.NODE_871_length_2023_cov_79.361053_g824_i0~~NODE_871_length_2023_cov_79.361053_g824_i0.p1  ORF type:complete len:380 (+),score=57.67 NODE_871_length_2023_cov_79.361053_g824_i0:747-1886(+)
MSLTEWIFSVAQVLWHTSPRRTSPTITMVYRPLRLTYLRHPVEEEASREGQSDPILSNYFFGLAVRALIRIPKGNLVSDFHLTLVQSVLAGTALYVSAFVVMAIPILTACSSLMLFMAHAAIAIIPIFWIGVLTPDVVRLHTLATHLELMKDPELILQAQFRTKTKQVLNAIKILHLLSHSAAIDESDVPELQGHIHLPPLSDEQIYLLRTAFDLFDQDHSNTMELDEITNLLKSFTDMSDNAIDRACTIMDRDGDGTISFEEFCFLLGRHMNTMLSFEEEVNGLWRMFAGDQPEISCEDMRTTLNALGCRFTAFDIRMLFLEVDDDFDGTIDKQEFEQMMQKFAMTVKYYVGARSAARSALKSNPPGSPKRGPNHIGF